MKQLTEEQKERVNSLIAAVAGIEVENKDQHLADNFGFDSMDNLDLIVNIENEFGITIFDEMAEEVQTVKDIYEGLAKLL